ncbi:MAG: hypothetical protein QOF97_3124 [Acidimicrobiaceae bacterium]
MGSRERRWAIAGLAVAITVGFAGVAVAGVSDGNYRPERQGCTGHADDSDHPDSTEPGCQSLTGNVRDGNGDEAVRAGFAQTADGQSVDPTSPQLDHGTIDPTTGVFVYFGADDNLDNGEHDSSEQIGDGPSDGGAVVYNVDPASVAKWLAAVQGGDVSYLLTHPLPLVDAGFGSCADGICESVQTQQRVAYQGGGTGQRDVADYQGKEWDPASCGGPSDTAADCGPGGISTWQNKEGTAYVEPGAQVYEDPNPEGSPIGPYPLTAVYAGTCGVIVGGGQVTAPASPVTNDAGQVKVSTGC